MQQAQPMPHGVSMSQPGVHHTDADVIENLPVDQSIPSHNELRIVDTLFKQKMTFMQRLFASTKDILLLGILFIIFSLPQVDSLLRKFIPIAERSSIVLVLIKTCLFMIIYYVIKNMYLVRKKK